MNRDNESPSHDRQSLRLRGYDYTQTGAYFVSITGQKRLCLFGEVTGERMRLNEAGQMIQRVWQELPQTFPTIEMDYFVVMPNHLHGIVVINARPPPHSAPSHSNDIPVGTPLVGAQNRDAQGTAHVPVGVPLVGTQGQDARETRRVPTRGTATEGRFGVATAQDARVSLGDVIGACKSLTTVEYIRGVKTRNWPPFHGRLWQRNYYEHVVRNDESLLKIRQYILDNPARWALDRDNPQAVISASERT